MNHRKWITFGTNTDCWYYWECWWSQQFNLHLQVNRQDWTKIFYHSLPSNRNARNDCSSAGSMFFLGNLLLELSPWCVIVVKFTYTNDNYCNHYPFAKIQEFSTSHRGIQSQGTARSLMRAWTKWTHRCDTDHQAIFFFNQTMMSLGYLGWFTYILWVVPPPRIPVTTRIMNHF